MLRLELGADGLHKTVCLLQNSFSIFRWYLELLPVIASLAQLKRIAQGTAKLFRNAARSNELPIEVADDTRMFGGRICLEHQ